VTTPLEGDTLSGSPSSGNTSVRSSRRLRTMLHTAPIHALEANKAMWDGDWDVYDMRRLQIAAIETTLDHQGLEGGITRTSLKDAVAAVAAGDGSWWSPRAAPGGGREGALPSPQRGTWSGTPVRPIQSPLPSVRRNGWARAPVSTQPGLPWWKQKNLDD
jgi:hypothetical protein